MGSGFNSSKVLIKQGHTWHGQFLLRKVKTIKTLTKNWKRIEARLGENLKVWVSEKLIALSSRQCPFIFFYVFHKHVGDCLLVGWCWRIFILVFHRPGCLGVVLTVMRYTVDLFDCTDSCPSFSYMMTMMHTTRFQLYAVQVQLQLRRTCVHWSSRRQLPCGDAWCVQGGACFQCTSVHCVHVYICTCGSLCPCRKTLRHWRGLPNAQSNSVCLPFLGPF